jgi:hypothetical protein
MKLPITAILVTTLGTLLYLPAGADGDQVTADVTPLVLSVQMTGPTAINYGALPLSIADDTRTQAISPTLSVKNTGSVQADLMIHGSDATNGIDTDWLLDCSDSTRGVVGSNQFAHRFETGSLSDATAQALCSGSDKLLTANVAVGGETQFELQMNMPTASTGYGLRTTSVTVVAVSN